MSTYNVNNKRLNVVDFQHPADRKSIAAVKAVPGFEKVLNYISTNSIERVYSFINNSSRMKITPEMSPKLHNMLLEAAEMYGVDTIPDLYLERSYQYVINLDGMHKPYIVLPGSWLEKVDDQMLWAVLSAQIAGIQANHETMEFIETAIGFIRPLIPGGVDTALDLALADWNRNRVYTADRAILLALEDFNAAAKHILFGDASDSMIEKIELDQPNNPFYEQSMEFLSRSGVGGVLQRMETVFSKSQWLASRYIELYNWYCSGEFEEILERSVCR